MKLPNGFGTVKKLSGRRRRPYAALITVGWRYDPVKDKMVQVQKVLGYAETKREAYRLLEEYWQNPYDLNNRQTFAEVFTLWSEEKYPTISDSNIKGYNASYRVCEDLYDKPFRDIRLADLQAVVNTCGKNYPTLKKLKNLFNQLYKYAMMHELCNKNYAEYVSIEQFKDKNPDKRDANPFTREEIEVLWDLSDNPHYQIILMLIYNGCRISELLDLKKENVNLEEQYFEVVSSKTDNGIRRVPIADKVLPFYKAWYETSQCEYLLRNAHQRHFDYSNYYECYFQPLMEQLGMEHRPHDTRHTCVSMLTEAGVEPTVIKKIVGHSGAMNLTERVYTHLRTETLLEAINKI